MEIFEDNGHIDRADWPVQWIWKNGVPDDLGVEPWNPERRLELNRLERIHFTADGYEIREGVTYWNNNLEPVKVTEIASHVEGVPGKGPLSEVAWHRTTRGSYDGSRLVYFWRHGTEVQAVTANGLFDPTLEYRHRGSGDLDA